jgi:hypothetical protein
LPCSVKLVRPAWSSGQDVGIEAAAAAQPFRLKGPAIDSIMLEAEIGATDSLEYPERNAKAVQVEIAPQLSALESMANPTSPQLSPGLLQAAVAGEQRNSALTRGDRDGLRDEASPGGRAAACS